MLPPLSTRGRHANRQCFERNAWCTRAPVRRQSYFAWHRLGGDHADGKCEMPYVIVCINSVVYRNFNIFAWTSFSHYIYQRLLPMCVPILATPMYVRAPLRVWAILPSVSHSPHLEWNVVLLSLPLLLLLLPLLLPLRIPLLLLLPPLLLVSRYCYSCFDYRLCCYCYYYNYYYYYPAAATTTPFTSVVPIKVRIVHKLPLRNSRGVAS